MKVTIYKLDDECLRLRISLCFVGFLFIILGIQGIMEIYNHTIQNINNITLYSSLFIVIGFILLTGGIVKCIGQPEIDKRYYLLTI